MINKITQILLSITIIIGYMMVLFFTIIGIDAVFKMETALGYIFTILCSLDITLCSCYAVINAQAKAPKDQVKL
tara:strand:- start:263 stop:484 length:222 start_codon:yes stop_codon:yes gene_type:complete